MSPARCSVVVVALACAGCRMCTTTSGETVYEKLDGPVKVSLVREARTTPQVFSNTAFVLRVETTPPFDEPVTYTAVDLAEDKTGTLVAFRGQSDGEHWRAIRLGAAGEHVLDCSADLGGAKKPDFTKLAPLADAAPAIVACQQQGLWNPWRPIAEVYDALADMLRETGGAAAVRAFLAKTSDAPFPPDAPGATMPEEPWMREALRAPTNERAAIDADLCPALVNPARSAAYVRAARRCPLTGAAVGDAAVARMRAELPSTEAGPLANAPITWAVPIAATLRPADAGAAACAYLTAAGAGADYGIATLAYGAIGAARTKCDAVPRASPVPCNFSLDCDGGLCSASDVREPLDAWLALDAGKTDGVRDRFHQEPLIGVAFLAAAYAAGPLPREVTVRNARRHYDVDSAGPYCWKRQKAGAACECTTLNADSPEACALPLDGGAVVFDNCSVQADDRARRLRVTHACLGAPDAGACKTDGDCCDGLRCAAPGGGPMGKSSDGAFGACTP